MNQVECCTNTLELNETKKVHKVRLLACIAYFWQKYLLKYNKSARFHIAIHSLFREQFNNTQQQSTIKMAAQDEEYDAAEEQALQAIEAEHSNKRRLDQSELENKRRESTLQAERLRNWVAKWTSTTKSTKPNVGNTENYAFLIKDSNGNLRVAEFVTCLMPSNSMNLVSPKNTFAADSNEPGANCGTAYKMCLDMDATNLLPVPRTDLIPEKANQPLMTPAEYLLYRQQFTKAFFDQERAMYKAVADCVLKSPHLEALHVNCTEGAVDTRINKKHGKGGLARVWMEMPVSQFPFMLDPSTVDYMRKVGDEQAALYEEFLKQRDARSKKNCSIASDFEWDAETGRYYNEYFQKLLVTGRVKKTPSFPRMIYFGEGDDMPLSRVCVPFFAEPVLDANGQPTNETLVKFFSKDPIIDGSNYVMISYRVTATVTGMHGITMHYEIVKIYVVPKDSASVAESIQNAAIDAYSPFDLAANFWARQGA